MLRAFAVAALLVLSGCATAGIAVLSVGLSIASQAVGLAASSEQLASDMGLRVFAPAPAKACPVPPAVPFAEGLNGVRQ